MPSRRLSDRKWVSATSFLGPQSWMPSLHCRARIPWPCPATVQASQQAPPCPRPDAAQSGHPVGLGCWEEWALPKPQPCVCWLQLPKTLDFSPADRKYFSAESQYLPGEIIIFLLWMSNIRINKSLFFPPCLSPEGDRGRSDTGLWDGLAQPG